MHKRPPRPPILPLHQPSHGTRRPQHPARRQTAPHALDVPERRGALRARQALLHADLREARGAGAGVDERELGGRPELLRGVEHLRRVDGRDADPGRARDGAAGVCVLFGGRGGGAGEGVGFGFFFSCFLFL